MNLENKIMEGDFIQNIIIFGNNDLAQLAHYYYLHDTRYFKYNVVAFTVEEKYLNQDSRFKQQTWAWENIEKIYSPLNTMLFVPIADNVLRKRIYNEGKAKGYKFISYISSKCTNYASKIGENCFIQEDNTLQPFTEIGNNVIMWAGNHLGHHSIVEDNVFITSHVVISGHCNIGKGAYLGVNACIRDGVTIGENAVVGMGAVVTKDIPNGEIWIGNPAKKK